MYKLLRTLLFLFPPESVHYFSMNLLNVICQVPFAKKMLCRAFQPGPAGCQKEIFGLKFRNIVGLGAGFDKNARYLTELEALGFGFVEIGTVTPQPQAGNDKPRLFRLPADKALINRMGFNNDGVKVVARRLKQWQEKQSRFIKPSSLQTSADSQLTTDDSRFTTDNSRLTTDDSRLTTHDSRLTTHNSRLIIGGNIGKNKATPNEDAWKDYEACFLELFDWVDYFVVNVSSPNTPGLRQLQEKASLQKILSHLQALNVRQATPKPILLKIAPDLSVNELDDVIDLALEIKLHGLVATNTTVSRDNLQTHPARVRSIGPGGLSGKPLQPRCTEIARHILTRSNGSLPFIASGGIFTGKDAVEKLAIGASLIQVWTGFIYEGPSIVKNICIAVAKRGMKPV